MCKKILVLGGTGAMGTYLVPELLNMNHKVDVVSYDSVTSDNPNLNYYQMDATDTDNLKELLKNGYDGIVDFMIYPNTVLFTKICKLMLKNTKHYIYLSSYRIYGGSSPINEDSPRLLDCANDKEFLAYNDYSLYKAAQENFLQCSKYNNWTIIRPAITYSKRRFQLTTLEANIFVSRTFRGKKVVVPKGAIDKQATMTWGGDVAKMIARLLFNDKAYREAFSVTTSEHHTWREIAEMYRELIGLDYYVVPDEEYLKVFGSQQFALYQLKYDRCFNRVMDNAKILNATGLKQSDLTTLKDGLKRELAGLNGEYTFTDKYCDENMDKVVEDLNL